jgi:hypothetical protein
MHQTKKKIVSQDLFEAYWMDWTNLLSSWVHDFKILVAFLLHL